MLRFDDSFAFIWFHRRFITPKRVRKREKREGEDVPPSPSKLPQNKQTTPEGISDLRKKKHNS